MPNLNLPTNITPGVTATFEADVEAAWAELNRLSRDTGRRDVTSLLANGWTATRVLVQRISDRVFWEFTNLNGAAATSATLMSLSTMTGFAPVTGNTETPTWRGVSGTGFIRFSGGQLAATAGFAFPANTTHIFDHRTEAAFPNLASLPGISA